VKKTLASLNTKLNIKRGVKTHFALSQPAAAVAVAEAGLCSPFGYTVAVFTTEINDVQYLLLNIIAVPERMSHSSTERSLEVHRIGQLARTSFEWKPLYTIPCIRVNEKFSSHMANRKLSQSAIH